LGISRTVGMLAKETRLMPRLESTCLVPASGAPWDRRVTAIHRSFCEIEKNGVA